MNAFDFQFIFIPFSMTARYDSGKTKIYYRNFIDGGDSEKDKSIVAHYAIGKT